MEAIFPKTVQYVIKFFLENVLKKNRNFSYKIIDSSRKKMQKFKIILLKSSLIILFYIKSKMV